MDLIFCRSDGSRVSVDLVHPSLFRSSSLSSPEWYHLKSLSSYVVFVSPLYVDIPPQSHFPAPLCDTLYLQSLLDAFVSIDIISKVRKMKWSWAGHINRLKDDRWTSRVTTRRQYDQKRREGRPAMRWRDNLDKYWSDTIWQRSAQDRLTWRRHEEAFAQPRDTIKGCPMMMKMTQWLQTTLC